MKNDFKIKLSQKEDVPLILRFIKNLADYEKLSHEVKATEELIEKNLFGDRPVAECIIGYENEVPVGFALFFHNFSTFVGKPGLYLEDVFVLPEYRGKGYGKGLLLYLANLAKERNCGRFEWSVLSWNTPSIDFYKSLGAEIMEDWRIFRITEDKFEETLKK